MKSDTASKDSIAIIMRNFCECMGDKLDGNLTDAEWKKIEKLNTNAKLDKVLQKKTEPLVAPCMKEMMDATISKIKKVNDTIGDSTKH